MFYFCHQNHIIINSFSPLSDSLAQSPNLQVLSLKPTKPKPKELDRKLNKFKSKWSGPK